MANENSGDSLIPSWIEPSIFEPVFKEIVKGFKQIKDFKAIPALSAGENYATLMLRLKAEIELIDGNSKSISLMLKTAHNTEASKEILTKLNLFEVEDYMYKEVVPELEQLYKDAGVDVKFAPKLYEITTDNLHILLEDLKPKSYSNINRLEGMDILHTQAVLSVLAQWHAASAVRIATKGAYKTILPKSFFREDNREMMFNVFNSLTDAFLKCAKAYEGNEEYYDKLCEYKVDLYLDDMIKVNELNEHDFNVLNHGDCWSNNIMFKHDELGNIVDTYLVDHQVPHFGTPAQDLYYLLLSSTKYELKIAKFDYFIKYYHERLIDNLTLLKYDKKIPSLKDLHIMLHKYYTWAYNASIGILAAILLDPSENAKMENYLVESEEATKFKLQLYSNPRYRKHMEMVLPWLHYRGVF